MPAVPPAVPGIRNRLGRRHRICVHEHLVAALKLAIGVAIILVRLPARAQESEAQTCEYRLSLKSGWNLVSLPIEPEVSQCDVLFPDPLTARGIWCYEAAGNRYRRVRTVVPLRAYWVFCRQPTELTVRGRLLGTAELELSAGWNAFGPAVNLPMPEHPDLHVGAWTWDTEADHYIRVTGRLEPGRGYWFIARRSALRLKLGLTSGDADGDGLPDGLEALHGTDPQKTDSDGDGLPDWWEIRHGLDPLVDDNAADPDRDGISNLREWELGLDPHVADTGGIRVQFEQAATSVAETAGTIEIGATLNELPPHNNRVTARVEVLGGTAVNGQDYELAAPVLLEFNGRGIRRTFTLRILTDTNAERPETIILGLTGLVGAQPGLIRQHRVVIADAPAGDGDADGDGLPDAWEMRHFGDLNQGPDDDPDGDGESNRREYLSGRNPKAPAQTVAPKTLNLQVGGVIH